MPAVTNNTPRSGKYPLTLAAGVVLKANKAVFGAGTEYGDWLEPGTYGGQGALTNDLIDAAHKIDLIGGDGILTVKSPGHPGLVLLVR